MLIVSMMKIRYKKKEMFFFVDFCWVIQFLYLSRGIVYLLKVYGIYSLPIQQGEPSKEMFYALWGIANGPLAIGVFMLKNALLLHDLEEISSVFIHINPPLITWAMRWHADLYEETWSGIFKIPQDKQVIGFLEIFYPAAKIYLIWAFFYLIWQFV